MKDYLIVLTPIILGLITLVSSVLNWRYKASRSDLAKMMKKEEERDSKVEAEFVKIRQENEELRLELEERERQEVNNLRTELGEMRSENQKLKNENQRLWRELENATTQLRMCEDSRIGLLKKLAVNRLASDDDDEKRKTKGS